MTSPSGPCVLVVDDEPMLRESICEAFNDEGFRTVGACNGEDAIRCLANGHVPDVILLDLDMPIMDGAGFHDWLRAQPSPLGAIPIVLVSANIKVREIARVLQVQGYLQKPVLPDALVESVQSAIASRSRRPGRVTPPRAPKAHG